MIDVAAYIAKMVREHELLIIPGLGGFLTHFHGASLYPLSNRMQSPGRYIAFNTQLKDNDGLLAHSFAKESNMSYKDALYLVKIFVETCKEELANNQKISFENLGVLSQNSRGIIEFSADLSINYADEYFGLPDIVAPLIKREKEYQSVIQLHPQAKEKIKSKAPLIRKTAAIAVPLLFLGVLGYFTKDQVGKYYQQSAALVSLHNENTSTTSANKEVQNNTIALEDAVADSPKENTITAPLEAEAENIVRNENTVFVSGDYHIICGAFSKKKFADRLLNQLDKEGFKAYVAGQNSSGLYRVSLANFTNQQKAIDQLRWVQSNYNAHAWLLIEEL